MATKNNVSSETPHDRHSEVEKKLSDEEIAETFELLRLTDQVKRDEYHALRMLSVNAKNKIAQWTTSDNVSGGGQEERDA